MSNLDWRTKTFLFGGVVGALLGLSAAYIYVNSIEKDGKTPELRPTEAVAIGLSLLGLLRQIANMREGDDKGKKKLA